MTQMLELFLGDMLFESQCVHESLELKPIKKAGCNDFVFFVRSLSSFSTKLFQTKMGYLVDISSITWFLLQETCYVWDRLGLLCFILQGLWLWQVASGQNPSSTPVNEHQLKPLKKTTVNRCDKKLHLFFRVEISSKS